MGEEIAIDYLSNGYEAGANNAHYIAQSLIGLDEGHGAEALLAGLISATAAGPLH